MLFVATLLNTLLWYAEPPTRSLGGKPPTGFQGGGDPIGWVMGSPIVMGRVVGKVGKYIPSLQMGGETKGP